jgi:hypothetical protein
MAHTLALLVTVAHSSWVPLDSASRRCELLVITTGIQGNSITPTTCKWPPTSKSAAEEHTYRYQALSNARHCCASKSRTTQQALLQCSCNTASAALQKHDKGSPHKIHSSNAHTSNREHVASHTALAELNNHYGSTEPRLQAALQTIRQCQAHNRATISRCCHSYTLSAVSPCACTQTRYQDFWILITLRHRVSGQYGSLNNQQHS